MPYEVANDYAPMEEGHTYNYGYPEDHEEYPAVTPPTEEPHPVKSLEIRYVYIPGEEGPQGAVGEKGDDGKDGNPGKEGAVGDIGPTGYAGPKGPQGPQGPTGAQGPIGLKGYTGVVGD